MTNLLSRGDIKNMVLEEDFYNIYPDCFLRF